MNSTNTTNGNTPKGNSGVKKKLIGTIGAVAVAGISTAAYLVIPATNQQSVSNSTGVVQQNGTGNINNQFSDDRRPHSEIPDNRAGVPVFSNWVDATSNDATVPRLPMGPAVEVSCMMRNDNTAMTQIAYWYKISSGPYAGQWAPSNDFANGDPVGVDMGANAHNEDPNLPLCTN